MEIAFYSYYAKFECDPNSQKLWEKYSLGDQRYDSFSYLNGSQMLAGYLHDKYSFFFPSELFVDQRDYKLVGNNQAWIPEKIYLYAVKDLLSGVDFNDTISPTRIVSRKFINLLESLNFKEFIYYPVRIFLFDRFGTMKDRNEFFFKALQEYESFNFDYLNENVEYTDSYVAFLWLGDFIDGFSKNEAGDPIAVECIPEKMPAMFRIKEYKGKELMSVELVHKIREQKITGVDFHPIYIGDTLENIKRPWVKRS